MSTITNPDITTTAQVRASSTHRAIAAATMQASARRPKRAWTLSRAHRRSYSQSIHSNQKRLSTFRSHSPAVEATHSQYSVARSLSGYRRLCRPGASNAWFGPPKTGIRSCGATFALISLFIRPKSTSTRMPAAIHNPNVVSPTTTRRAIGMPELNAFIRPRRLKADCCAGQARTVKRSPSLVDRSSKFLRAIYCGLRPPDPAADLHRRAPRGAVALEFEGRHDSRVGVEAAFHPRKIAPASAFDGGGPVRGVNNQLEIRLRGLSPASGKPQSE